MFRGLSSSRLHACNPLRLQSTHTRALLDPSTPRLLGPCPWKVIPRTNRQADGPDVRTGAQYRRHEQLPPKQKFLLAFVNTWMVRKIKHQRTHERLAGLAGVSHFRVNIRQQSVAQLDRTTIDRFKCLAV